MMRWLIGLIALTLVSFAGCSGGAEEEAAAEQTGAAAQPLTLEQATPIPQTARPTPAVQAAPEEPKYGGTMIFRGRRDPRWDPHSGISASDEGRVYHFIYSRLFVPHQGAAPPPDCQLWPPQPELAESWDWVDELTLDVTIRKGAKFADSPPVNGREITAEDVAHAFVRPFNLMPAAKPQKDVTESIVALDKQTVRFKLKSPFPTFIQEVLTKRWAYVVPKEITPDDLSMKWEDHRGHGSGPFVITDYKPSTSVEFAKNPNYFVEGLPYLDGITEPYIGDESSVAAALRTGKVDFSEVRSDQLIRELHRTAPQLKSQVCPYPAPFVISIRTDRPPLDDVRVRQALSMALDRDAFGKSAYGNYFPKYSPVHAGLGEYALPFESYPPEIRQYISHNPAEAKRLLTEAGYGDGFEVELGFLPPLLQGPIAEFVAGAWAPLGVNVNLKPMEFPQYSTATAPDGEYGDMVVTFQSAVTPYEALYYYFKCGTARNYSRVCDEDVERMLDKLVIADSDDERRTVVYDLQKHLVEKQYAIDAPQSRGAGFWQPYLKDAWYRTDSFANAHGLKYAWLDK
jgi:peptide/nickel transport system substrate-binding protein